VITMVISPFVTPESRVRELRELGPDPPGGGTTAGEAAADLGVVLSYLGEASPPVQSDEHVDRREFVFRPAFR
jgi:hypothetical protein